MFTDNKANATSCEIYTMQHWIRDREFMAKPGQEITREVYDQMLNALPPRDLPAKVKEDAPKIKAGFLMGEPYSNDNAGNLLYMAFGETSGRYFYIGLYSR